MKNVEKMLEIKIIGLKDYVVELEELVKVDGLKHANNLAITRDLLEMAEQDLSEIR